MVTLRKIRIYFHAVVIEIPIRIAGIWRIRILFGGGGAAGIVALLLHTFGGHHYAPPVDPTLSGVFKTQLGEHRCESLPDQSVTCLNTHTVVRYVFDGEARRIYLDSGEASFQVHKDDSR